MAATNPHLVHRGHGTYLLGCSPPLYHGEPLVSRTLFSLSAGLQVRALNSPCRTASGQLETFSAEFLRGLYRVKPGKAVLMPLPAAHCDPPFGRASGAVGWGMQRSREVISNFQRDIDSYSWEVYHEAAGHWPLDGRQGPFKAFSLLPSELSPHGFGNLNGRLCCFHQWGSP